MCRFVVLANGRTLDLLFFWGCAGRGVVLNGERETKKKSGTTSQAVRELLVIIFDDIVFLSARVYFFE